jgi:hypothetical protein
VIRLFEGVEYGAAQRCIAVKDAVKRLGREAIGQFLGAVPVVDAEESIVFGGEADALDSQSARQPAVAVAINLQAERCPGWNPDIDQPKFGVDEVEIVMQALLSGN